MCSRVFAARGWGTRGPSSNLGAPTEFAAIEEGVPAPILTGALFERFASRDLDSFANKVMSAMRSEFGGHAERPA